MGADVIGLQMEIGADPSKAEAAMARLNATSVAESGKISSIWSDAMGAISGPTGIALGAIVGLGGGMLGLAEHSAEVGREIYDLSQKTGLAADKVSGLRALVIENGESFESLSTTLGRSGIMIERALINPGSEAGKILHALFTTTKEYTEFALAPHDKQLQMLLDHIFALNNENEQNLALQAFLSRGWQSNRESLKALADEGFAPAIEKAKQFHIFYDDKGAREAHAYVIEMHQLSADISGMGLAIGQKVLPRLTELWAEFQTVTLDTKLLGIGVEALGLKLVNFSHTTAGVLKAMSGNVIGAAVEFSQKGGIADRQLDDLAKKATDVYTAEHIALLKFKQEIADMGKALESPTGGAPLAEDGKEAAEEARRQTSEYLKMLEHVTEQAKRVTEVMDKWHKENLVAIGVEEKHAITIQEVTRAVDQSGLAQNKEYAALLTLTPAVAQLTAAQRAALPTLKEIEKVEQDLAKTRPNLTKAERDDLAVKLAAVPAIAAVTRETGNEKIIHEQLTRAILGELVAEKQLTEEHARQIAAANGVQQASAGMTAAAMAEVEAVKQNIAASAEQLAAGVAGLIGGRKAQAAVEVVWETAEGIKCLGEGTWPPNPAAIIAAGMHFEAAAQYAILAGKGSSRRSSAGAGAGGAGGGGGASGGRAAGQAVDRSMAGGGRGGGGGRRLQPNHYSHRWRYLP